VQVPASTESPITKTMAGKFLTTQWGLVARAGKREPEAFEGLCRVYWPAIYSYSRRVGHAEEEAKDLTQGFFSSLCSGEAVSRADRERGRFRSFLLTMFKRYVANELRAGKTWKRGGRLAFISWEEFEQSENSMLLCHSADPEQDYDLIWARAMLESVMQSLKDEYQRSGKEEQFRLLSPRLSGHGDECPRYSDIAKSLQLGESAVKMAMKRMRQRFGDLLRESVAATVSDPCEIDDEIRHLLAVLGA
jgi:RNA polymerase sigma factor (sigma-70 family)